MELTDILNRFKKEFKGFKFLSKNREQENSFIRCCFYVIAKEKNPELSLYKIGKIINMSNSVAKAGYDTGKTLIAQKDAYFLYFYKRALKCLDDNFTETTPKELIKIKDFEIKYLKNEIRRLKQKNKTLRDDRRIELDTK